MQPPHASINGTFLLDFAYCVYDMKCLIEYYYACRIILHSKYYSVGMFTHFNAYSFERTPFILSLSEGK